MEKVYIGRQAIYNKNLDVFAYELLFHADDTQLRDATDADQATSQVLLNTLVEIGANDILGSRPALFRLTHSFILGILPLPLPTEMAYLVIGDDIELSEDIMDGVHRLVDQGYSIVLDGCRGRPEREPLLALASMVRLDNQDMDMQRLASLVSELKARDVKLLAANIETHEQLERCKELGFDYLHGPAFSRPDVIEGRRTPGNRLAVIRLLSRLQEPDIEVDELNALIAQDVALTHRLLRYLNCAAFGLAKKVESIQQAVVLIGLNRLKMLASLLALTRFDDKPTELLTTAMVRARMCEELGARLGREDQGTLFTVGLLSTLDALMDQPMKALVGDLPLADEVSAALVQHDGPLGQILTTVISYEGGHWKKVRGPHAQMVSDCYLKAIAWADATTKELLS